MSERDRGRAGWSEPAAPMWRRRLITGPGFVLAALVAVPLSPAVTILAALWDLLRRRPFTATRFVLALTGVLVMHVVGLAGLAAIWLLGGGWRGRPSARELSWEYGFEAWWAHAVWRLAARIYAIRLVIEGDEVAATGPFLLLSRHVSLLDTLLPIAILTVRHGRRLRFVMKRELLWDPCLDALGHRVPTAFVHRGGRDHAGDLAAVEALLEGLGEPDAIALYPEGTRFSPAKRDQVLGSLARRHPHLHQRAARLRHVLPPHPGGPLGLLVHRPDLDVVFCAHVGLEGANRFGDLLAGALIGRTVHVHYRRLPAAEVPREPEACLDWLYERWAEVDDWVDAHREPA
ncbi:1-acyl-sn-glycerol-3-phosphate acyltransferase [Haliangium sp.]|uniref:lysophospholipid acyltransferase family protein n=1 Tax=Haliangium sp. TaxID=2663208 RepID=UPI003D0C8E0E